MAGPLAVLLHGLWMTGFELGVLRRRLEAQAGMRAVTFSYPSMRGGLAEHVRRLIEFARAQSADEMHFVGHSLGGLVILGALQATGDLPPGRAGRGAHRAVRQGDAGHDRIPGAGPRHTTTLVRAA